MSRIDEALKRAAQGPIAGGRAIRGAEARIADEFTLGDYPLESKASTGRVDRADVLRPEAHRPEAFRPEVQADVPLRRPETRLPAVRSGTELNEKLVISPRRNEISTEQYRRLAATLHEAQVEKGLKTVMVTSAAPREGKTLTTVNLAYTLSESYGRRVLIIDADLRRPAVHELFGLTNERGLSDVLRSDRLDPPVVQVSSRLSVLLSGQPDKNPLAGLSSERMRSLLAATAERFDWVLLDTPPVGLLSDAQLLGRLAQAAILVIRAGQTSFAEVEHAINELGRDCIIGTVLNGVDKKATPATSYYSEYGTPR